MILAIDVGFTNTGWSVFTYKGVLRDCGTFINPKSTKKSVRVSDDYMRRIVKLSTFLKEIINQYNITIMLGEAPSGGAQNAKASSHMSMAYATTIATATVMNVPSEWCTALEVKLAIAGYKSATKKEIIQIVRERYSYYPNFPKAQKDMEHVADSIGVYQALKTSQLLQVLKQA